MQQEDSLNARDNETKIQIALINAQSKNVENTNTEESDFSEEARANLQEKVRQFNEKIKLDRERLEFDKNKAKREAQLKEQQINKMKRTNNS